MTSVKGGGLGGDQPPKRENIASPVSRQDPYASAMATAIAEARAGIAAGHGGPFGAVVLKGESIVGRGHNCVLSSHDPTAHAEVMALRDASKALGTHVLSGCTLVTTCEPCPMCFSAAFWARVETVVYAATRHDAATVGFDDAVLYEILSVSSETDAGNVMGPQSFVKKQVSKEGVLDLFREWQQSEKKELY